MLLPAAKKGCWMWVSLFKFFQKFQMVTSLVSPVDLKNSRVLTVHHISLLLNSKRPNSAGTVDKQ
jgi:hypothetical protein